MKNATDAMRESRIPDFVASVGALTMMPILIICSLIFYFSITGTFFGLL